MAVRMRNVLQTAGLVFECVTCFFRVSLKIYKLLTGSLLSKTDKIM